MQKKINCQSSLTSTMEQKKRPRRNVVVLYCYISSFVHPFRVLPIKDLLTLLFFHIPMGFNMLKITKSIVFENHKNYLNSRAKVLSKIWCCAWPELCILKFPRSNRTIWQRNLSVLTRQFSTILVIQEFQAKKSVKCLRKEIFNQTLVGYLVK